MPPAATNSPGLGINHDEKFPDLVRAPIVEAVIQINGRIQSAWEEGPLGEALMSALPEYTRGQALNAMRMTVQMQDSEAAASAGQPIQGLPAGDAVKNVPVATNLHAGFEGVRLASSDGLWVAQFTREFFALSRLAPYENWRGLCDEALRLWEVHSRLGGIQEVSRIACRFINRVEVPIAGLNLGSYFEGFEVPPRGFPVVGFLHHSIMSVPGYPYLVNLIRTHQAVNDPNALHLPLILDLEAYMVEQTSRQNANIPERLADLRWVKNKVFFASVTDQLLARCR